MLNPDMVWCTLPLKKKRRLKLHVNQRSNVPPLLKVGTIDIETAPLGAQVWGLRDQNVSLNQISREWSILSYCVKPFLKGPIVYKDTSHKKDPRDDSDLCESLWDVLHEYDVLIAQNGLRFDLKKIRARLLMYGYRPPSPCRVEDTLRMSRQVASFTSHKLEWLSKYLTGNKKSSHAKFPGQELWTQCLAGNRQAWSEMRKYNIQDVRATEELYVRLKPWTTGGVSYARRDGSCRSCGEGDLQEDGLHGGPVNLYIRYHCPSCGAWSRGYKIVGKVYNE
jgi:RNase_H superfamily